MLVVLRVLVEEGALVVMRVLVEEGVLVVMCVHRAGQTRSGSTFVVVWGRYWSVMIHPHNVAVMVALVEVDGVRLGVMVWEVFRNSIIMPKVRGRGVIV